MRMVFGEGITGGVRLRVPLVAEGRACAEGGCLSVSFTAEPWIPVLGMVTLAALYVRPRSFSVPWSVILAPLWGEVLLAVLLALVASVMAASRADHDADADGGGGGRSARAPGRADGSAAVSPPRRRS